MYGNNLFSFRDGVYSEEGNKETFNTYRNKYLKYIVDMENLELQYDILRRDIINNTTKESTDNSIKYYEDIIEGYAALKESIVNMKSSFTSSSVYKNKFDEYSFQVHQLEEKHLLAEDIYTKSKMLEEIGGISSEMLKEAETSMEVTKFSLDDYKSRFMFNIDLEIKDAQDKLDDIIIKAEGIVLKDDLLELNQTEKNNTTEKLRLDTLVSIDNQILQLEITIDTLKQKIPQTYLQKERIYFYGEEIGEITISRVTEINKTLSQIKTAEQELMQLESNLVKINAQIEASTVKAQIDGKINEYVEIVKGNYLLSGADVMSIIPMRDAMLNANVYVNNNDIVGIDTGMTIRYDIYALPRRDYGEISGFITKISEDIKTERNGTQGYYLVEADIEDKKYFDANGKEAELKVGMNFEAKIITGRKKILFYLLEMINLID